MRASAPSVCAPQKSSELAKWLIATIPPTLRQRAQARVQSAARAGSKPRRCMPVSNFSHTRSGAPRIGFQHGQLAIVVHDRVDVERAQQSQVGGLVEARQQHDAVAQADRAQALGVGQRGHAEGLASDSARATRSSPWP
jgi:hypothetical protein